MENQTSTAPFKKKIKLDFKDSKYATGRRKKSIAKVWLKKDLDLCMLMEKKCLTTLLKQIYKLLFLDP